MDVNPSSSWKVNPRFGRLQRIIRFASRLYPGALDVIRRIILSDGDVVFQPLKIERSGLWAVVEGRVLIYIHKEKMLDAVAERYPARHYAMIDDKLRALRSGPREYRRLPTG